MAAFSVIFSLKHILVYLSVLLTFTFINGETESPIFATVKGKLHVKSELAAEHKGWLSQAHVFLDGGDFIAVPNRDGEFSITGVPKGAYMIEVSHPTFVFPRYRVEVSSKGKIRARVLNHVEPNKVDVVKHPVTMEAMGKAPYFQKREEWKISDLLKNPMVLMMVLPMLLMFIMPKMMSATDEETKKEMEQQMNMFRNPNQNMPDLSEKLTGWLSGGSSSAASKSKRRK